MSNSVLLPFHHALLACSFTTPSIVFHPLHPHVLYHRGRRAHITGRLGTLVESSNDRYSETSQPRGRHKKSKRRVYSSRLRQREGNDTDSDDSAQRKHRYKPKESKIDTEIDSLEETLKRLKVEREKANRRGSVDSGGSMTRSQGQLQREKNTIKYA